MTLRALAAVRGAAIAATIAAALALPSPALATTHRIAVLVGNNSGSSDLKPLRFAEADAGKMARVLAEVGGLTGDDLFLLQGRPRKDLEKALTLARSRADANRQSPSDRVLLIFYFSGHSDGEALELGSDRVTFDELRSLLAATTADVRVVVVDSCRSGALLATKGGVAAPAFDIRMNDDLAASGQVLLASSAADEVALESANLGGSVFTYYFASGLRGAADISGDGRVTLTEAYQYAYQHTLARTAATTFGAQHPSFDYRLSGQGELVLADLSTEDASLELPAGFAKAVVNDVRRDQVVAELTAGAGRALAVSPGEYAVEASRDGQNYLAKVTIAQGEHRALAWSELSPFEAGGGQAKGPAISQSLDQPDPALTLGAFGGAVPGVGLAALAGARVNVAGHDGQGPQLSFSAGTGSSAVFRETALRADVGWRIGTTLGSFQLSAGPALGGGTAWQSTGGQTTLGDASLQGGVAYAFTRRIALALDGQVGAEVLRENGSVQAVFLPEGWLGLRVGLGE